MIHGLGANKPKGEIKSMDCVDCSHMKSVENSEQQLVYLCTNVESGSYLSETGVCGNCDLDEEE